MKVAIVGATRGMGRALARRLAERGDALFAVERELALLLRAGFMSAPLAIIERQIVEPKSR